MFNRVLLRLTLLGQVEFLNLGSLMVELCLHLLLDPDQLSSLLLQDSYALLERPCVTYGTKKVTLVNIGPAWLQNSTSICRLASIGFANVNLQIIAFLDLLCQEFISNIKCNKDTDHVCFKVLQHCVDTKAKHNPC